MNLWYGPFFGGSAGDKPISKYKVICTGPEEKIVGMHLIGKMLFNSKNCFCFPLISLCPLSLFLMAFQLNIESYSHDFSNLICNIKYICNIYL